MSECKKVQKQCYNQNHCTCIQNRSKQIFGDVNYAWDLLQFQIKFQLNSQINGEDISRMLMLYMRGVERMNSLTDIRQSFFKNKVTSLMSRPAVIKILNKPMTKKTEAPVVQSMPIKTIDSKIQIQLQEKRKQMQMRMAYGAQQHNADNLRKMLAEQNQKQSFLTQKIDKIVDSHQERLMKRIKQRKLRTMTAKSRPDVYNTGETGENQIKLTKQMMQKKRDQQQFGKGQKVQQAKNERKNNKRRKVKSISPPRSKLWQSNQFSPSKRRVSMDFRGVKIPQSYQEQSK